MMSDIFVLMICSFCSFPSVDPVHCFLSRDIVLCLCLTGLLSPVFLQAALQELEELKQIVPKESLVYFLIGKVKRRLESCLC